MLFWAVFLAVLLPIGVMEVAFRVAVSWGDKATRVA